MHGLLDMWNDILNNGHQSVSLYLNNNLQFPLLEINEMSRTLDHFCAHTG